MTISGAQRPFDSWDALKLLALLLMFIDHSGAFLFTHTLWLRAIGRGAMPVFLFLGGFAASYRLKWSLLALAVLMSVSDFLLDCHLRPQNILFLIIGSRLIFYRLERRGRIIEHPWQWFMVSLAWLISAAIVQYGSIGFLFAVSGYLKRHKEHYPPKLPRHFLIATFLAYACYTLLLHLPWFDDALVTLTLYGVYLLLDRFEVHSMRPSGLPPAWLRAGKWISYYSGYIYAFHLIALEWATGIPF